MNQTEAYDNKGKRVVYLLTRPGVIVGVHEGTASVLFDDTGEIEAVGYCDLIVEPPSEVLAAMLSDQQRIGAEVSESLDRINDYWTEVHFSSPAGVI